MRLVCPNCDAQYEVPVEVIPTDGRDVQCSNCGQTWFQHHPDHPPAQPPEPEPEAPPPPTDAAPRDIDPAVADILRAEAEAETRARAAESLESQPELGLDTAPDAMAAQDPAPPPRDEATQRADDARTRMARMRGEQTADDVPEPPAAAAAAAALGSRRDLLPDIEEINSTLRSTTDRRSAASADGTPLPKAQTNRRAFRRGFALSLMIAALALVLYAMAPRIIEEMPQAEAPLTAYTSQIDAARLWLDGQVTRFLTWLDSMAT
ncbi:MAG: zinc-ribbon domain-containing protein [Pseudomonadota bacterium]